ncbi:MAG: zinc carboxypeptidase [Verrucomicrobia bacterium]|nr:zinc carboxypeptidase [Verrucomicrobiota bacterium]
MNIFCLVALAAATIFSPEQDRHVLVNGDFESAPAIQWEKRTPDDKVRQLLIVAEAARTGKLGARIVNKEASISRWRYGADKQLKAPTGATVRLAGWIRADLGAEGGAALRLYCIGSKGEILKQPQTQAVRGKSAWKRVSVSTAVPEGCDHLMVYLELDRAAGSADYDDIVLSVVPPAKPRPVLNDLALLTDATADDPMVASLRTLYPDRLVVETTPSSRCRGAVVFARQPGTRFDFAAIEEFAQRGNPVVVDLAVYAAMRNRTLREVISTNAPMLRVVRENRVTAGFKAGDVIPWCSGTAKRWTQRVLDGVSRDKVMAESPEGGALVVAEKSLLATDLTGLREPVYNQPGSFNKYLFAGNALGGTVRYGQHYAQRLNHAEFVEAMRKLVAEVPGLRLEDEGPASGDCRMYSINYGDPEKPAFFVYGVTHGSEWEPAYGLLRLARHLALVDAKRYSVKIIPILNPSGYDLNKRQNAAGIDLNRNGGEWWESFKGRDSNNDGTWGSGDYDWKGDGPFSEPETQTFRAICKRTRIHAALDFHGNSGGPGNNRIVILPLNAREDNEERAEVAVRSFNEAMRNRYVLQQANRPGVAQYDIEMMRWNSQRPTIIETASKGSHGFLVEVPAGYPGTYGMVMQTDIVVETCLAFVRAYQGK